MQVFHLENAGDAIDSSHALLTTPPDTGTSRSTAYITTMLSCGREELSLVGIPCPAWWSRLSAKIHVLQERASGVGLPMICVHDSTVPTWFNKPIQVGPFNSFHGM